MKRRNRPEEEGKPSPDSTKKREKEARLFPREASEATRVDADDTEGTQSVKSESTPVYDHKETAARDTEQGMVLAEPPVVNEERMVGFLLSYFFCDIACSLPN